MKYVLTIGGKSGPFSHDEFVHGMNAFFMVYGCEPTHFAVMPEAVDRMTKFLSLPDAEAFRAAMTGGGASVFGLAGRAGPEYRFWA